QVRVDLAGEAQGGGAVGGDVDLEAREPQRGGEELADVRLVVDDQEPRLGSDRTSNHESSMARISERCLGVGARLLLAGRVCHNAWCVAPAAALRKIKTR